ncbi:MAG: hypothetical protein IAI50_03040, partial [Candidatus Eremiobacteraeota bacterium]|nr:hypothetical protein [Candidatus Eremiobacteraeota bacterium]
MVLESHVALAGQGGTDPRAALPLESPHPQPTAPLPALPHDETIDRLLTPTSGANDPAFVHLGSLRVEASLFAEFSAAQRHLARDPEALKLLSALERDASIHTIHGIDASDPQGDRFDPRGTFDPKQPVQTGGDIYWDPHSALRSNNGTTQTPALALLHEQGHAWEWKTDPHGYLAGFNDKSRRYDTAEEQRNETGLERRAAAALGEGTRRDHGGTPYGVAGSTSRTPTDPRVTHTPEQLQSLIENGIANLAYHGYATPPPPSAGTIHPWDHKAHSGTFIGVDQHTVAQHVGRGAYEVYDVERDLHGHYPDQTRSLTVDARGHIPQHDAHAH